MANAIGQTSTGAVNTTTIKDNPETDVDFEDVGKVQGLTQQAPTQAAQASTGGTAVDSSATVTQGTAQEATADERQMSEQADASVQANKIMAEDSPLMRMAKQEGMLTAARRGLGNSSIAAGAAQAEMSKAAVPLAQQNAAQQQRQELTNQGAANTAENLNVTEANRMEQMNVTQANQANQFDAGEQNKFGLQDADNETKVSLANASEWNKSAMQKAGMDGEIAQTWLSGEISKGLTSMQSQYQVVIAQSQVAAQMYQSTMDSMADMWANSEIPVSQKTALGQVALRQLENSLKTTASITGMEFRDTFNY
jgi:hypothetical protein